MGTTLALIIAGILWLVYLAPAIRRNREYESTQRNAIRINQALRAFAQTTETPAEIQTELSHREALIRQRERERIEREQERALRAQVRAETYANTPEQPARKRSVKLSLSVLALAALVATGVFGFSGQWTPTIVALVVCGVAAVGLVLVNSGTDAIEARVQGPRFTGLPEVDETWTPQRVPKVHRSVPEGAGLIVTPETEQKVEAAERVARIREQAARAAATSEPVIDPRFAELGLATEEVPVVDINAALRARRAQ